ncbi:U-box domain-containing protein 35-like [Corylus avellana]|uniref:U-box domain-containing protein 35-like n=1 Tax=Corylus avellana TaxID=13451 RepID=UPI00286A6232|nr:U-box domain-containing protein 35-like [Corylus avellana]
MSVSMSEESYAHRDEASAGYHNHNQFSKYSSSTVCEIEEESPSETFEINHGVPMASIREEFEGSLFSVDVQNSEDSVYVGVGKSDSSMDALAWTLKHAVTPSTIVYLVHVFPEVRYIPSPLGKLPKHQVSPEQVESYMAQERDKRGQLLQKFLDACSTSKVKVDTILIESDMVASAIRDLIPILNIRTLVVGTTKSSLRKLRSKRGSGVADQMLQNAAEGCVVKVICEGKEVTEDQMIESPSPRSNDINPKPTQDQEDQRNDTFSCMCFKI